MIPHTIALYILAMETGTRPRTRKIPFIVLYRTDDIILLLSSLSLSLLKNIKNLVKRFNSLDISDFFFFFSLIQFNADAPI